MDEGVKMTIDEIRGAVMAYKNIFNIQGTVLKFHNFKDVKRSNQFYDVTIGNERVKIKAWDLPGQLFGHVHSTAHRIAESNNDEVYCCKKGARRVEEERLMRVKMKDA